MALCISPLNLERPGGTGAKDRHLVPCGRCPNCLTNRRNDWAIRLKIELEHSTSGHFITLTYDDEKIKYNENHQPSVFKKDLQNYVKRLRKTTTEKLRYYAVGEYGTKSNRPHYHVLLFNYPKSSINNAANVWPYGFTKIGTITMASILYTCKYHVNKTDYPEDSNPSFTLMSRNPGIGNAYLNKMADFHEGNPKRGFYYDKNGVLRRLPRYLKDKLYSKEDKRQIPFLNEDLNEKIKIHYQNNPEVNYYSYENQQKIALIENFKQKTNLNNKF